MDKYYMLFMDLIQKAYSLYWVILLVAAIGASVFGYVTKDQYWKKIAKKLRKISGFPSTSSFPEFAILKDSNLPKKRIKEALNARKRGNGKAADHLLQEARDYHQKREIESQQKSQQKRARITFLQGNIANEDFRWHEALDYYKEAVELAPENIRYFEVLEKAQKNYDDLKNHKK